MTRTLAGLCAATALGVVTTLGAQTPNPEQPAPQQPPSTSAAAGDVKVTGCLAKEGTGFILNSAMVEAPDPGATGTSGTVGAAGATAAIPAAIKSATSFRVQGVGLDTHVGQRIELTGSAMATPPAAGADKEDAAAGARAAANAPTLTAKSVRMVSATC